MKPPFLNGSSSPVRLRVPSAKTRIDGHEVCHPQGVGEDRDAVELDLVDHPQVQASQHVEEDRRIDVALVVRAEDRAAVRDVLAANRADARARGPQRHGHAEMCRGEQAAIRPGEAPQQDAQQSAHQDEERHDDVGGDRAEEGGEEGERSRVLHVRG